ncbi:Gal mutarotas 2 domain containing protein, partial [Asbolus verrucosus]
FFTFTLVVTVSSSGSDSLSCSEIEFCNDLRNRAPANLYIVDLFSVNIDDFGIISFTLQGRIGYDNLEVYIFALKDDILRIKIKEFDSTRFELVDVFAGAPSPAGIASVESTPIHLTITTNIGSRLVVWFAPFYLEFFRNDVLELILDGDRLLVENRANSEAFSLGLVFPEAEVLYGIHQHASGLVLKNTEAEEPYRMFNVENSGYPINSTASIYGTIPLLYGHGREFTAGIFLHNAAQQFVDIIDNEGRLEAFFMAEAGTLDLFVFLGPTPAEVLRQYLLITGIPHMPPMWSLGYHQSRFSYLTQDEVKEVVANFDKNHFQLDSIWLDVDYTDGQKFFTWNPETFPDPIEMQQNLSATNRKLVTISDPQIKAEKGYSVYDGALENNLFLRNPDGTVFEGTSLPGTSSFLDFLDYEARVYYAKQFSYENFASTTPTLAGVWNDINEPVVFDLVDSTIPGDCVHHRNVTHRELHNAYGLLHTRATHQGLLDRDNGTTRPFILTRSHFAGSQRYAAFWTGDSDSTWEYLAISYSICLNANIMGIVFCGGDVGGFLGDPDDELYQRWYQAAAWLPFFRSHSNKETKRREPYLYSEDVQGMVRNAIQLRYKHLPVWYTLFHEYIAYKTPVIRPLFFHYPRDRNTFSIDNQILVGSDILVRAVTEPGVLSVPVYFPGGAEEFWFSEGDFRVQAGSGFVDVDVDISSIPIYYRAGSVIVRKETVSATTADMINDGHTLYVCLNVAKTAHGTVYLDDTTTLRYRDNIEYNYLSIDYAEGEVTFTQIDTHANSDKFDFIVDLIVTLQITEMPASGKPGKYVQKKYATDSSGNLLKDL